MSVTVPHTTTHPRLQVALHNEKMRVDERVRDLEADVRNAVVRLLLGAFVLTGAVLLRVWLVDWLVAVQLTTHEVTFREHAAKAKFEIRRHELVANQMKEKLGRETAMWQRKLELKDDEIESARATVPCLGVRAALASTA